MPDSDRAGYAPMYPMVPAAPLDVRVLSLAAVAEEAPRQAGADAIAALGAPVQEATPIPQPNDKAQLPGADEGRWTACCGRCSKLCVVMTGLITLCVGVQVYHRFSLHVNYDPLVAVFNEPNTTWAGSRGNLSLYQLWPRDTELELHHRELLLLGTLYRSLCGARHDCIVDVLRGAHVVVRGDRGAWHSAMASMPGAYARTSSHPSGGTQYGISEGSILRTILTGTECDSGDSWLQLEGAECNWRKPGSLLLHMLDWVQYELCDCNVGVIGTSQYTQDRPLVLPWAGGRSHHAAARGGSAAALQASGET